MAVVLVEDGVGLAVLLQDQMFRRLPDLGRRHRAQRPDRAADVFHQPDAGHHAFMHQVIVHALVIAGFHLHPSDFQGVHSHALQIGADAGVVAQNRSGAGNPAMADFLDGLFAKTIAHLQRIERTIAHRLPGLFEKTIQAGLGDAGKNIVLENHIPAVGQENPAGFLRQRFEVIQVEHVAQEIEADHFGRQSAARRFRFQARENRFQQRPEQADWTPPPEAHDFELHHLICILRQDLFSAGVQGLALAKENEIRAVEKNDQFRRGLSGFFKRTKKLPEVPGRKPAAACQN